MSDTDGRVDLRLPADVRDAVDRIRDRARAATGTRPPSRAMVLLDVAREGLTARGELPAAAKP